MLFCLIILKFLLRWGDWLLLDFGRVVNDLSVPEHLDAVFVPALFLVPGVAPTVDVPANEKDRLLHDVLHGLSIQTINLVIVHLVLLSESLGIQPIKRCCLIRIGPN
jgi:hypothetical protein